MSDDEISCFSRIKNERLALRCSVSIYTFVESSGDIHGITDHDRALTTRRFAELTATVFDDELQVRLRRNVEWAQNSERLVTFPFVVNRKGDS